MPRRSREEGPRKSTPEEDEDDTKVDGPMKRIHWIAEEALQSYKAFVTRAVYVDI